MKKLMLNTNDLSVETFETNSQSKVFGTVKGNKDDCTSTSNTDTIIEYTDDCQPTQMYKTCGLSCGGSCMLTCGDACQTLNIINCPVSGQECEPSTL